MKILPKIINIMVHTPIIITGLIIAWIIIEKLVRYYPI